MMDDKGNLFQSTGTLISDDTLDLFTRMNLRIVGYTPGRSVTVMGPLPGTRRLDGTDRPLDGTMSLTIEQFIQIERARAQGRWPEVAALLDFVKHGLAR